MSLLRSTLHATAVAGALLIGTTATASAGAKLPLASAQTPPRFVDVTSLSVDGAQSDSGYRPRIITVVHGVTSSADAIRLDWMHKGKVIATKRCNLDTVKEDGSAQVQCTYDGKPLTVAGALTAQLIYIDDQAEQEYLLRELAVTVGTFTFVGKKYFQVLQDDNLGQAYVEVRSLTDRFPYFLKFYFWAATDNVSGKLRCTAAGTKLEDINVDGESGKTVIEALDNGSGEEQRLKWTQMTMGGGALMGGTRDELAAVRGGISSMVVLLADHPGDWSCDFRKDGAVFRTFRFHVNDKGRIDPLVASGEAGMPLLRDGVVMIDVRLPKSNAIDLRVRKAAIKGSMAYGMPWPKSDGVAEMLKAAPDDSGFPDPGKAKGKKKGKKK